MSDEPRNQTFDPERGWVEATPMKPPRQWPWLQRVVDWLWSRRRALSADTEAQK